MGLAILVVVSFFVVRGGEDTEWKLINVLIILGSTSLGVAGTLIIEHLIDFPRDFPGTLTLTIGIVSGFIGCFIAGAWNYWRSGGIYKGKKGPGTKSDKNVV
jgi:hypothetical protein